MHSNLTGRGLTIIAIIKPRYGGDAIISKYADNVPNAEWRFLSNSAAIYENLDRSGTEATLNFSSNYEEWQVIGMTWEPGGRLSVYKNGYLMGTSAYATADIPNGTSDLLIGVSDISGMDYYGEIGEIIAISDTPTKEMREAMVSKLGAKWGIDTAVFSSSDSSPFGRDEATATIKPLIDNDNIETGGYITGQKCGVFAFLSAEGATTCTAAATYYPILGTFTNSPIEQFGAATTYTPGIKYTGTKTQYFEIDWHGTLKGNSNTITAHIGIKKNNTIISASVIGQFLKNLDQPYSISGTLVVELAENDEIQLVISTDGAGDIITFIHFTTSISEFFD